MTYPATLVRWQLCSDLGWIGTRFLRLYIFWGFYANVFLAISHFGFGIFLQDHDCCPQLITYMTSHRYDEWSILTLLYFLFEIYVTLVLAEFSGTVCSLGTFSESIFDNFIFTWMLKCHIINIIFRGMIREWKLKYLTSGYLLR